MSDRNNLFLENLYGVHIVPLGFKVSTMLIKWVSSVSSYDFKMDILTAVIAVADNDSDTINK